MGLTVSTKVGNSAVRSRIKRLVREAYRRLRATEARLRVAPLDLVFIARPDQSVSARLCDIEPEVRLLVAKVLETQR